ncbi:hypothetical protein SVIOM74S_00516 [Streptomyces violarus]
MPADPFGVRPGAAVAVLEDIGVVQVVQLGIMAQIAGPAGPYPSSYRSPPERARRASASALAFAAARRRSTALGSCTTAARTKASSKTTEANSSSDTRAVVVVVRLPAVRNGLPPRPPARFQSRPGGSIWADGMGVHPPVETAFTGCRTAHARPASPAAHTCAASHTHAAAGQRRTCPSPVTMYFVLVSSGRPIGPRACSFCVEMPISAPKPNWPPSVNRVEAFTATVVESTNWVKPGGLLRAW